MGGLLLSCINYALACFFLRINNFYRSPSNLSHRRWDTLFSFYQKNDEENELGYSIEGRTFTIEKKLKLSSPKKHTFNKFYKHFGRFFMSFLLFTIQLKLTFREFWICFFSALRHKDEKMSEDGLKVWWTKKTQSLAEQSWAIGSAFRVKKVIDIL